MYIYQIGIGRLNIELEGYIGVSIASVQIFILSHNWVMSILSAILLVAQLGLVFYRWYREYLRRKKQDLVDRMDIDSIYFLESLEKAAEDGDMQRALDSADIYIRKQLDRYEKKMSGIINLETYDRTTEEENLGGAN